jgi:hypothetical protein
VDGMELWGKEQGTLPLDPYRPSLDSYLCRKWDLQVARIIGWLSSCLSG